MATVRVSVAFDSERDADLLAWLDAQPNRSEVIRAALTRARQRPEATLADVVKAIESLGERLAGLQLAAASPASREAEDPDLAAALEALGRDV